MSMTSKGDSAEEETPDVFPETSATKRGKHRRASSVSALKAARVGRSFLAAAFTGHASQKRRAVRKHGKEWEVEPLEELAERPTGRIEVDFPASESAWDERLRDLMRTLQGGSLFIAGRQRLRRFQVSAGVPGDVSNDAAQAGLNDLMKVIGDELSQQGVSLSAACQQQAPQQRQTAAPWQPGTEEHGHAEDLINAGALREVARQVAAHISVSPGMQAAVQTGMPPSMWQPMYVICIGCAQIRVMAFAFIGGPAIGDRPDSKRTPFVLRLTTSDLMNTAFMAMDGTGQPKTSPAWYTVEPTAPNSHLILDHVTDLEEELFRAIQTGDWGLLSGATMDACRLTATKSASFPSQRLLQMQGRTTPTPFAGVM